MERIDLRDCVREFCADVTLVRSQGQQMRKGKYETDIETQTTIPATVLPLPGKDLQLLPEGSRNAGGVRIYTEDELLTVDTSDCKSPDKIISAGVTYQIESVKAWIPDGCFFESLATRVTR